MMELKHEPGTLYRALAAFAKRGINLTKLESRPLHTKNWQYRFYLDFEGHPEDAHIRDALEELKLCAVTLRILGSYPASIML
jgi:prephenate dehydratase